MAEPQHSGPTISHAKGVSLCLASAGIAIVPSALYHGASLPVALLLSLAAAALAVAIEWGNAWRYQFEPAIRKRWFYVNLASPAVLVLAIQAIGWRTFSGRDSSPVIPALGISLAHAVAWAAAVVALALVMVLSLYLRRQEPRHRPQTKS